MRISLTLIVEGSSGGDETGREEILHTGHIWKWLEPIAMPYMGLKGSLSPLVSTPRAARGKP